MPTFKYCGGVIDLRSKNWGDAPPSSESTPVSVIISGEDIVPYTWWRLYFQGMHYSWVIFDIVSVYELWIPLINGKFCNFSIFLP